MKINYKWTALALVLSVVTFAGCSDDDKSDSIDPSKLTSNAVIVNDDGEKLLCSKIGSIDISYDSNNLPIKVDDYLIRYEEGVIIDRYDDSEYTMALNSTGFISKLSFYEKDEDYEYSFTANFSYDNSGHLTKISVTGKDIDYSDDSYYDYICNREWTGVLTVNWNGDNVKSSKIEEKTTHKHTGGENFTEKSTYTNAYYVTDSKKNILGQYTYSYGYMVDSDILEYLVYTGLLGKAPANLITGLTNEWNEDSDDSYYSDYSGSADFTISYNYNSDGTIKSEVISETGYTNTISYSYIDANSSRSLMMQDAPEVTNQGAHRPHRHDILHHR